MYISKYASYKEVTKSNTAKRKGIPNNPNTSEIERLQKVCQLVFDNVRRYFGVPIHISSGFRSRLLNEAIGGARNSQHMKGEAIDIDADEYGGVTNKQIFDYIKNNLDYDQLIGEKPIRDALNRIIDYRWVHVSYISKEKNRKQTLIFTGKKYLND